MMALTQNLKENVSIYRANCALRLLAGKEEELKA